MTQRLSQLFQKHLKGVFPAPDANGGGNHDLSLIYPDIDQWDTFIAGMTSSYISYGKKQEHLKIIRKAKDELPILLSKIDGVQTNSRLEQIYKHKYINWTRSLIRLTEILNECYKL